MQTINGYNWSNEPKPVFLSSIYSLYLSLLLFLKLTALFYIFQCLFNYASNHLYVSYLDSMFTSLIVDLDSEQLQ